MIRRPTSSMKAMNPQTLSSVRPNARAMPLPPTAWPSSSCATGGNRTSATTIARSSTTSQPTAIRPRSVLIRSRACMARSSTTVLATDSASPNTRPAATDHPSPKARPSPSSVATAICTSAPGTAIFLTDNRSRNEKCRPTPNISRITPSSASSLANARSATKPGVNGPTITPANRYPATGETRSRWAMAPMRKATTRPAMIVAIRGVWCGMNSPGSRGRRPRERFTSLQGQADHCGHQPTGGDRSEQDGRHEPPRRLPPTLFHDDLHELAATPLARACPRQERATSGRRLGGRRSSRPMGARERARCRRWRWRDGRARLGRLRRDIPDDGRGPCEMRGMIAGTPIGEPAPLGGPRRRLGLRLLGAQRDRECGRIERRADEANPRLGPGRDCGQQHYEQHRPGGEGESRMRTPARDRGQVGVHGP